MSRGRSASRRRKSNVNIKGRSRSLVLFSSTRFDLLKTLSTANTPPPVTALQAGGPQTTQTPSNSETNSERLPLEKEASLQGSQLPGNQRVDICAAEQEGYREPLSHDSLDSAHRKADLPCPKAQKLKTVPRLKIMVRKLIASLRKTKRSTPSPLRLSTVVNPPSSPNHLAPTLSHQDIDQGSLYFTPPSSEIADDDAATFYTAMTWESEDPVGLLDENDPSGLHPSNDAPLPSPRRSFYFAESLSCFNTPSAGDREVAKSDARILNASLSSSTLGPSDDAPAINLPRRPRVDTCHSIPSTEEPDGVSPSTSSSGSMPPSPQSVGQVDSARTAQSPAVTSGKDIGVDSLTDEIGNIDSNIFKINSPQSLLFQMRLDIHPPEDARLPPLSPEGALGAIHSGVAVRRKSTYDETQGGHPELTIGAQDTRQDVAVALACSSPTVAIPPELVPLPCDEGDLGLTAAWETPTCSIIEDQAIMNPETRAGGQASFSTAMYVGSEPKQPPLPEGPSDLPSVSWVGTQETSIDVFRAKHLDRMPETQTIGQVIGEASLPADARGGRRSQPQPSDKQPLGGATPGAGSAHGLIEK
ncbi:hypothetical protein CCMSSC00406_0004922 [Pleurotus cornucopiae]|uniref:Uncharacterized protein n=1 Tax=Pleurotus cornucopiae TaxID=5321 RepID=A0ACB7IZM1_PLECO|nr:hypothetical protein CCMSSC00406_0004922 [Pleurotus cornucopiae]